MSRYLESGQWHALIAFVLTFISCIAYGADQYGFFIGVPIGFFVGIFFGFLAGSIAALLWPVINLALVALIIFFIKVTVYSPSPNTNTAIESPDLSHYSDQDLQNMLKEDEGAFSDSIPPDGFTVDKTYPITEEELQPEY